MKLVWRESYNKKNNKKLNNLKKINTQMKKKIKLKKKQNHNRKYHVGKIIFFKYTKKTTKNTNYIHYIIS